MALPLIPDPPPQGHAKGQHVSRGCRFPSFQDSYAQVVRPSMNPFQTISRKTKDLLPKPLAAGYTSQSEGSPCGFVFI